MYEEKSCTLGDGRTLAYFDLGDPSGPPVVHHHGAPSGKLETAFFNLGDAAAGAGVRLLAVDRPGIGGSTPRPGRTLLEWADDVEAFADRLDLEKFSVMGYSMGTPSALACLHRIPHRLNGISIVSGSGPSDVPGLADGRSPDVARVLKFAQHRPRLTSAVLAFMKFGTRRPEKMIAASGKSMPEADQAVAAQSGAAPRFAAFLADAMRHGTAGVRDDMRLAASPWGFTVEDAGVPAYIWHGAVDRNVPVATAHWLSGRLPSAELQLVEDGGHISVLDSSAGTVLQQLHQQALR
ncbi:MAG: alpha/beta fold hydrolase [Actinomycetota bacterium]